MNFVDMFTWRQNEKEGITISAAVKRTIDRAPGHESGHLEHLGLQLDKVIEIVALIAAQLPEEGQIALAHAIGFTPEVK